MYIPGEEIPKDTYRKMIDAESVSGSLILRTPEPEDRIIIDSGKDASNRVKTKKLTRLFTDSKIPVEERAGWPVVADDGKILWVVGLRLSEICKVKDSTKEVLLLDYCSEAKEG